MSRAYARVLIPIETSGADYGKGCRYCSAHGYCRLFREQLTVADGGGYERSLYCATSEADQNEAKLLQVMEQ